MPKRKNAGVDPETAWQNSFEDLRAYKREFGHCLVPSKYDKDPSLGAWVRRQRGLYADLNKGKKSTITPERIKKLESVGFVWRVTAAQVGLAWRMQQVEGTWQKNYHRLKAYKNKHGHCFVELGTASVNPDDNSTYDADFIEWIDTQRNDYKMYKQERASEAAQQAAAAAVAAPLQLSPTLSKLTNERANMLDIIGFEWEGLYLALKTYRDRFGHCLIPAKYGDNQPLADWVKQQRAEYLQMQTQNNNKGVVGSGASTSTETVGDKLSLTAARVECLKKIGFHFEVSLEKKTNKRGMGSSNSNTNKRESSIRDDRWEVRLVELKQFKMQNGHCLVPGRYRQNPNLGIWVKTQRYQYQELQRGNKSTMTDYRRRALDDLGFVWCVNEKDTWKKRFQELKEYKRKNGHCLVPKDYLPNQSLRAWVSNQRFQYTLFKKKDAASSSSSSSSKKDGNHSNGQDKYSSTLTNDRVKALNDIGFIWDDDEAESLMSSQSSSLSTAAPAPSFLSSKTTSVTLPPSSLPPTDISEIFWRAKVSELRKFKEKHGHCHVPLRYKVYPKLGTWVKAQRNHYRKFVRGKPSAALTTERVAILQELGFEWDENDDNNDMGVPGDDDDMGGGASPASAKHDHMRMKIDGGTANKIMHEDIKIGDDMEQTTVPVTRDHTYGDNDGDDRGGDNIYGLI